MKLYFTPYFNYLFILTLLLLMQPAKVLNTLERSSKQIVKVQKQTAVPQRSEEVLRSEILFKF